MKKSKKKKLSTRDKKLLKKSKEYEKRTIKTFTIFFKELGIKPTSHRVYILADLCKSWIKGEHVMLYKWEEK